MDNQSLQNQNTFYNGETITDLYQTCAGNNVNSDFYLKDLETGNDLPYQYYPTPLVEALDDSGNFVYNQASPYDESISKSHSLLFSSDSSRLNGGNMEPAEALNILLQQYNQERTGYTLHSTMPSPLVMQPVESFDTKILSPPMSVYGGHSPYNGMLSPSDYPMHIDRSNRHRPYEPLQEILQKQHQYRHQNQLQDPILEFQEQRSYFGQRNTINHGATNGFRVPFFTPPEDTFQGYIYRNLNEGGFIQKQAQSGLSFELKPTLSKKFIPLTEPNVKTNMNTSVVHKGSNTPQTQNYKKNGTSRIKKPLNLQCDECHKTFSRPYNLKSHRKTHTKEKPYACSYPDCPWRFARPHDLKRHTLCLHDGIKPYSCTCGKRFARSDAFKRHQTVDVACASMRKTKA